MKVLAIVQARTNSSRLPRKILKKINNNSIIEILLKRLNKSKILDRIVVSTTTSNFDDDLVDIVKKNNFDVFRGNEKNVLDRFYKTALKYKAKNIVRITGDCPLIDAQIVDKVIRFHFKKKNEITSNSHEPTFPDGMDIEIFSFNSLKNAWKKAKSNDDKEHVTPFIKRNYLVSLFKNEIDYSNIRITLDEAEDFELIYSIVKNFKSNIYFSFNDILNFYKKKKKLFEINKHIKRDEGRYMSKNDKLWTKAKSLIPGGNMFYSKRPGIFLNEGWPTYFKKAKGYKVWSLDNKIYYDLSYMGVGTNVLGYGNSNVDRAVKNVINKGNMSTLNAYEDVILAEMLLKINPWAEMVKFARTGGEANAVAMRIARASTKKKKVAVCGYHGWHDWYLASYMNPKNKKNFFNNPTKVEGVPKNLSNTIFSFAYNDIDQLKKIIRTHKDVGIIKMEVERNIKPKNNFLKKVRELASKNNIILIFDECTSGFRQTYGGLHKEYNIEPDMVIYGKALGNGYPITSILGKKRIMQNAEKTFLSSTFWSERIGTNAAIATIKEMKRLDSANKIKNMGIKLKKRLIKISKETSLKITLSGLDSMPSFRLMNADENTQQAFKMFITKEMLKKNFLATDTVYLSLAHNQKILDKYLDNLKKVFLKFRKLKKVDVKNLPDKLFNRMN